MPRQLRLQYPGAMYHVMNRGDRREKIFIDDVDRQDFIKTLAEACQKTGWQVHAYCLMPTRGAALLPILRHRSSGLKRFRERKRDTDLDLPEAWIVGRWSGGGIA